MTTLKKFRDGGDILPARWYFPTGAKAYAVGSDGSQASSSIFEVAVVAADCTAAWVAYDVTSDVALPARAVLGGGFANNTQLYVARMSINGNDVPGYYNEDAGLAYVRYSGTQIYTEMELLVVV